MKLSNTDFSPIGKVVSRAGQKKNLSGAAGWGEEIPFRALVIADDFTGAGDTGVQMRKQGIAVDVVLSASTFAGSGSMVLDTESRNIDGTVARGKVQEALTFLNPDTFEILYKKVDSTLRGNIVEELEAILAWAPAARVFFAPAYPVIGRTVRQKRLLLNGTPLMETEFAKDPQKPIRTDRVDVLLEKLGSVRHIGVQELAASDFAEMVRRETDEPDAGQRKKQTESPQLYTFDVLDEADLERIVQIGLDAPGRTLWVGSAGLANALFARLGRQVPALAVVGSISSTSIDQVYYAEAQGVTVLQPSIADLLTGNGQEPFAQSVLAHLAAGEDVILAPTRSRAQYEKTMRTAEESGIAAGEVGHRVQKYLAGVLDRVLHDFRPAGIFMTGGDTAYAIIEQLGAAGCTIEEEVRTGIVRSRLRGGAYDGIPIITKAGGFGKEDAVAVCLHLLKEREL
uniref:four-carbon acid sugar kinase family protein n=1 Tax=Ndongobacter massiliensis TaxID=1871025 RepID=UPI000930FB9E|nr:four-carbon acid sugar kinase family protein [Ndongobacter massiliensis]